MPSNHKMFVPNWISSKTSRVLQEVPFTMLASLHALFSKATDGHCALVLLCLWICVLDVSEKQNAFASRAKTLADYKYLQLKKEFVFCPEFQCKSV